MRRLVCPCVAHNLPKTGFLARDDAQIWIQYFPNSVRLSEYFEKLEVPIFEVYCTWNGPQSDKPDFVATNTNADQPVHPRSLVKALVYRYHDIIAIQMPFR